MRVVLDTNVLIAAFIARGSCAELFEYCTYNHSILLSNWLVQEFKNALLKKLNIDLTLVESALSIIRLNSMWVDPAPLDAPLCRDKDDDNVLALALTGEADCIITGDKDLLVLKEHVGISIIKPAYFWEFEKNHSK